MDNLKPQYKTIDPFYHPEPTPIGPAGPLPSSNNTPKAGGSGVLQNLTALNIGTGKRGWYVSNQQGMWMGDNDFTKAPFSVDMNGQAIFRDNNGQTIVDASGIKSDTQFILSTIEDFTDRQTTKQTPIDINFTQLEFLLKRLTNVFIPVCVTGYISGLTGGDAGKFPVGVIQIKIDGQIQTYEIEFQDVRMYTPEVSLSTTRLFTQSYQKVVPLAPGAHSIGLVMWLKSVSSFIFHVTQTSVSSITFGK